MGEEPLIYSVGDQPLGPRDEAAVETEATPVTVYPDAQPWLATSPNATSRGSRSS